MVGTDFTDHGTLVLASSLGPLNLASTSLQLDAGELWQDDRIVFRYPFGSFGFAHASFLVSVGSQAKAVWVLNAAERLAQKEIYTQ